MKSGIKHGQLRTGNAGDRLFTDRKTYNPRWAVRSSSVVTVEAIEATLPLILGRAEQIP
jgi:hypothetical protein